MKNILTFLTLTVVSISIIVSQSGCSGGYAVVSSGPVYRGPAYVNSWSGSGFYGGATYNRYYNNNSGGYYRNSRGGSAAWYDGSGRAYGARGGSASWNNGSGNATGWRGGTASWGGGSGSWNGPRGGSGSWNRR